MIEIRNVTKRYGGRPVVSDVSLTIPKGQVTSFIGPNGAGKSTLLSMMSRLSGKDSGEVLIDGREIDRWDSGELAKRVSILKQTNQIGVRLTVRELVSFGRYPYSKGRLNASDRAAIDEAIHYLGLEELQDRYLDQLSGGQCQRAYIAMTVAQNTDYVLLDEPLNNLDMKHAVQIMKVLRRLSGELGKTVVIVLHDINFASCYSDRIVALKHGKVVREGTAEEMISPEALREIYEMDIPVENIRGQRIGVYFAASF
ncbi:ABC transporter ATP-binding protein [Paenibacillus spiritus]|uniref:ABC transporter ATP-binding protein n=1 Tax=Paenibacillus spiritus TaxID=2496557 RepID=A0A5J5G8P3_9BACL|nr:MULTISPECIES: ABC transporter ATP-binding protein [Paenibacillus]KAA9004118.1 ABC transporter ATP-binding protein [Paenibacillus spiritus]